MVNIGKDKILKIINEVENNHKDKPKKEIEYVIYVRKSTDEKSGRQNQSIPDQIKAIIAYSKARNLKIKKKPSNFEFETKEEIEAEEKDNEISNREIFKDTRDFYIIKEKKSAKEPYIREKWRKLIKKIKLGEKFGLIFYSPNRASRNMLEGGELLDLVDEYNLSLKFTNFEFEDSASGKMMLGFWFVFSTHFSNDLSETVGRGFKSRIENGKALGWGYNKLGYTIEDGYHKPYKPYFKYVKEAFKRKIYKNYTDKQVLDYLNKNGVKKVRFVNEKGKEVKKEMDITHTYLNDSFKDPFYYGLYIYGKNETNLNETNPFFKPIITKEEYVILIKKYIKIIPHQQNRELKKEHNEINPMPDGILTTEDGYKMGFNFVNKGRFYKKLEKLREKNPNIKLKDIVKSHQISFRCTNKNSKSYGLNINYNVIEAKIQKLFNKININIEETEKYINNLKKNYKKENTETVKEKKVLKIKLDKLENEKNILIENNIGRYRDDDEERIYKKKINSINNKIKNINKKISSLNNDDKESIELFEHFMKMLYNIDIYSNNTNYVCSKHLHKIILQTIKVNSQKQVNIGVKQGLEPLFDVKIWKSKGVRTRTGNLWLRRPAF